MQLLNQLFTNILVALVVWLPGHSLAVAIIILTVLLRLILLIPNRRALESQRKIQELQPQIEQLKRDVPDQQEQAKLLMELYHKNQINPLGSCLPLLIQLPILLVLFAVLRDGFTERAYSTLYSFVPRPEYINTDLFGINLTKPDPTMILPILAAGFQLVQTIFMLGAAKKRGQNMPGSGLLIAMSIMTYFIGRQFNAGVVLYWVTQTLFGLVQQVAVEKKKLKIVSVTPADLPPTTHQHGPREDKKKGKQGVEITIRRPGQK